MGNSKSSAVEDFDVDEVNQDIDRRYGTPKKHDPEFRGPMKNRSCTDIFCLLLWLAFVGGWIAVAIYGFQNGDPQTLVYPSDSDGNVCGNGKVRK